MKKKLTLFIGAAAMLCMSATTLLVSPKPNTDSFKNVAAGEGQTFSVSCYTWLGGGITGNSTVTNAKQYIPTLKLYDVKGGTILNSNETNYQYTIPNTAKDEANKYNFLNFETDILPTQLYFLANKSGENTSCSYHLQIDITYKDTLVASHHVSNFRAVLNKVEIDQAISLTSFNITYDLNGGTNSKNNPSKYTVNDEVTLADPTKTGYTFKGWTRDEEEATGIAKYSIGDVSFTADWEVINYSINYNLDGGTLETSNPATYTVEDTVEFVSPTKEGYTFLGWFTENDQQVTVINKGTTGNKYLNAKWEKIPTSEDYCDAFVTNFMHPEIEFTDESVTNDCQTRYQAAKDAFNALDEESRTLFLDDAKYSNYAARLHAWATANGETVSAKGVSSGLNRNSLNTNNDQLVVVSTILGLSIATSFASYLLFKSSKKHAK